MNIKTVGELIEALQDYDPEMRIMGMHQQNWPLVEYVGGLYQQQPEYECPDCGNDDCTVYATNGTEEMYCAECEDTKPIPTVENLLFVVLNGQPHDNPYGTKEAWNEL